MNESWEEKFRSARAVADAVLYEGYLLYPYRHTSRKNRFRWQFGVLVPEDFALVDSSENSSSFCEFIVRGAPETELAGCLRFLRIEKRTENISLDSAAAPSEWEEGISVELLEKAATLSSIARSPQESRFSLPFEAAVFPERQEVDPPAETFVQEPRGIEISLRTTAQLVSENHELWRVGVSVFNRTSTPILPASRSEAMLSSAVGSHLILALTGGKFISSLDPPSYASDAVRDCRSRGLYAVLMGNDGEDDVLLCAPIVLYDRPTVAAASKGDFFDATEIDEMLTLRVLTLTEEEKAEARRADPRAARILEMCESMVPEDILSLHGEMREVATDSREGFPTPSWTDAPQQDVPWWTPEADEGVNPFGDSTTVGGHEVGSGSIVRLRPSPGRDAQDLFLAGRVATVAGVFRDVDGGVHLAVTVNDDPGNDLYISQGRYLFFAPEEIEPLEASQ